jgi:hypothetical protein
MDGGYTCISYEIECTYTKIIASERTRKPPVSQIPFFKALGYQKQCQESIQVKQSRIKSQKTELDGPTSAIEEPELDPHNLRVNLAQKMKTFRISDNWSIVAVPLPTAYTRGRRSMRHISSHIMRNYCINEPRQGGTKPIMMNQSSQSRDRRRSRRRTQKRATVEIVASPMKIAHTA